MNQPIEEKWKGSWQWRSDRMGLDKDQHDEIFDFIENLLEQERRRTSDALTISLDTSVLLDGWEKYWIDAENGRYIEGCVECGNSTRIKKAIINK